jgi:hypothetical protein
MKLKNYLIVITMSIFLTINPACGGAATSQSNNADKSDSAENTAPKNTAAAVSPTSPAVSTAPPATIEAGNITTSEFIDLKGSAGRMITATGNLVLVSEIEDELTLNSAKAPASGTPFNEVLCRGDFTKYTGIKGKIAIAVRNLNPPRATVKGTVAREQNQDGVMILESCVLADLKAAP